MKRWVLINSKVLPTSITRSLVYETQRERKQNHRKKNKNADNVGRNQTIVAKNQSNEHETAQIVLVPDKLQTLMSLGAPSAHEWRTSTLSPNSHPFYPLQTPCVYVPYTAIRSDLAVVCASCASAFASFAVKRRTPVYSR
jgi:hypothetical protein